ncbi:MAG: polyprenyl synthetase family protein [Candidatus Calescibacterium sp.]|nr:polyprenyl synthetase family protein [Candidatus Calescibacterium sp.]MDW8132362.1 polyprenyl synthetase family protein [Candidatus Calescibacterium sp.]
MNMSSLVVRNLDLNFLNSFNNVDDHSKLLEFVNELKGYTLSYIKEITDFKQKNWLISRINDYMIYSGKMVRSSFFYIFVLGMVSGSFLEEEFWDKIFRLGAIFELAHSATLVHDDILDGARKRRGKPSVHIKFGIDGAIIFGDILIISILNRAYDVNPLYSKILMKALENMCLGEVLQYQNKYNVYLKDEEYFNILLLKTGVLFGAISNIGYHLGCDYSKTIFEYSTADYISNLFNRYGVAFQIVDDILDYIQNEKVLKKDANNDLLTGRITYPLILLMKDNENREKMKRIWLKNPSYFSTIITKELKNRKSLLEESLNKSKEFMDLNSLDYIAQKIGLKDVFKNSLKMIISSLIHRQY